MKSAVTSRSTASPPTKRSSRTAFERLTTPRAQPAFKAIPYLPSMRQAIPKLDDFFKPGEITSVREMVSELQKSDRVTDWQANAMLRCAVPVFERLSGTVPRPARVKKADVVRY